jgi:hypothetical protein
MPKSQQMREAIARNLPAKTGRAFERGWSWPSDRHVHRQ